MANYYYQGTLRNLKYRLRKFRDYIDEYLEDYLNYRSTKEVVTNIVANRQLYRRGINGRGQKIMDYAPYSPKTIANKKRKGQPYKRVTLRDTGAFHDAFKVVVTKEGFYVTSDDWKTEALTKKYGNEIFRLTNDNFNSFLKRQIRKALADYIKIKYGIKTK